jgi:hypothetical protein
MAVYRGWCNRRIRRAALRERWGRWRWLYAEKARREAARYAAAAGRR